MGFDVCAVAGTEEEAISAAERTKPQLMIVDAQLGDGSGINAVDVIEQSGAVPHFFISGNSARVRALRPNALVVQKPFCEPELAQAIKQTMAVS
jgi:CheY-like chemotaxis protein